MERNWVIAPRAAGASLDGVAGSQGGTETPSEGTLGLRVTEIVATTGEGGNRLLVSNNTSFGELYGVSVPMRASFALMERAAGSDATVLLEGETGTGKGQAAEAIHQASARRSAPFVVVDCGAIPANLLE